MERDEDEMLKCIKVDQGPMLARSPHRIYDSFISNKCEIYAS